MQNKSVNLRKASKNVIFLMVGPIRGEGGKGRTTKEKRSFLKLEKNWALMVETL